MNIELDDLDLLACLFMKRVIGSKHRRVDSIAGLCHIQNKKGFKKRLKKLTKNGYLNEYHGPSYSLTNIGWRVGEKWDDGWTIEEIEEYLNIIE